MQSSFSETREEKIKMADFKQAIIWMKQGYKVRQPAFQDRYIYMDEENRICNITGYSIHPEWVNSTDWEIYEEDNWKISDECYTPVWIQSDSKTSTSTDSGVRYLEWRCQVVNNEGLEKLKEKLLEDIGALGAECKLQWPQYKEIEKILERRFGF